MTSSKIRDSHDEIHRKLRDGSLNFKITLGPQLEFVLCIRKRRSNIFNSHTEFQSFGKNQIMTLKKYELQQTADALVEGYIPLKSNSSYVIGYIKNINFYGTVGISENTFFIVRIEKIKKLFDKYKNTSYNALVYKTKRVSEKSNNDLFRNISITTRTAKRNILSIEDSISFKLLIGKG